MTPDMPSEMPLNDPPDSLPSFAGFRFAIGFIAIAIAAIGLAGCSANFSETSPSSEPASLGQIKGIVHGGQQPVTGASIQLYAASTSGYSAASSTLGAPVTSGANGSFTLGAYTCPSSTTQVYIVATGGNPGLTSGTNNPQLAMMAALGSCGNLSSSTYITLNEATTVAAVWALAPFMSDATHVGTSSTNVLGLKNAFVSASQLVSTSTGSAPGTLPDSNVYAPIKRTNLIANILAACVNTSGGSSGDGTACGKLMLYATPTGSTAPTNTIAAALNIAQEPGRNATNLYNLVTTTGPFQPSDAYISTDFALGITILGGNGRFVQAYDIAIDASGNIWLPSYYSSYTTSNGTVTLSGSGFIAEFGNDGSLLSPTGGYTDTSIKSPGSLAIDSSSNVWINNSGNITGPNGGFSGLLEMTSSGTFLSGPYGFYNYSTFNYGTVTIDGSGAVWAKGNSGIAKYQPGVGFVSPAPTLLSNGSYTNTAGFCNVANCELGYGSAIDTAGNFWTASEYGRYAVELNSSGAQLSPSGGYTGSGFTGTGGNQFSRNITIDANNNAWLVGTGLSGFSQSGTPLSTSAYTGTVFTPVGVTIDGANSIWILDSVITGGLVHYSTTGSELSSAVYGYSISYSQVQNESGLPSSDSGEVQSVAFAIDASGNIWTTGPGTPGYIAKMIGLAAPVVTPNSVALANNKVGARP